MCYGIGHVCQEVLKKISIATKDKGRRREDYTFLSNGGSLYYSTLREEFEYKELKHTHNKTLACKVILKNV